MILDGSGVTEPGPTRAGARGKPNLFNYYNFKLLIHTVIVISIHDQCLYTPFKHSFHQCNITEIKPQVKIYPQFGLLNTEKPSASGVLHHPDPLFYNFQFLGPAITKHSVTPLGDGLCPHLEEIFIKFNRWLCK